MASRVYALGIAASSAMFGIGPSAGISHGTVRSAIIIHEWHHDGGSGRYCEREFSIGKAVEVERTLGSPVSPAINLKVTVLDAES